MFKSVKTLGALHSQLCKRPRPLALAFFKAKNVEFLGLYPIQKAAIAAINYMMKSAITCCDKAMTANFKIRKQNCTTEKTETIWTRKQF